MADFRSVPGRSPAWHRTAGTFSNFEFIDSAPELFPGTRAKFGEVIVDATQSAASADALRSVRLPGHLLSRQSGQLTLSRTRLAGHTPLFTYSPA